MLSFEIKFRFEKIEEVLSFTIFEMQLDEEITFDQIRYFISRFFIDIVEQFLLDDRVSTIVKGE